jgi:hypothetical protein
MRHLGWEWDVVFQQVPCQPAEMKNVLSDQWIGSRIVLGASFICFNMVQTGLSMALFWCEA